MNVIQDGLHHDELIARVKKNERKFQFTRVDSQEALERERRNGAVVENGMVASRPSSSAKRKGRMPTMRPPDEFPTPAPKRQRRSEGSEGVHLNGDAMDVDAASASAEGDEDGEPASPAVASDPEIVEVPERYDSMDVGIQTDVKTGPKTTTMYWKVDKPGAQIFHSMWNPDSESNKVNTLFTVGESLCRFYQVPDDADNAKQVRSAPVPFETSFTTFVISDDKLYKTDMRTGLHPGRSILTTKLCRHSLDMASERPYCCLGDRHVTRITRGTPGESSGCRKRECRLRCIYAIPMSAFD